MKHIDLDQAIYIQELGEDKLVVTQNGQSIAILMPVSVDALEDVSLTNNVEFQQFWNDREPACEKKVESH